MVHSIVEYQSDHEGYSCGYCRRPDSNYSHGMWTHCLSVTDYQRLIDRGWRRSGKYCYKPTMHKLCCPMYTIRCRALEFKLSKSQKKTIKKVNKYLSNDEDKTVQQPSGSSTSEEYGCNEMGDQFVQASKECTNVNLNDICVYDLTELRNKTNKETKAEHHEASADGTASKDNSGHEKATKRVSSMKSVLKWSNYIIRCLWLPRRGIKSSVGMDSSKGPCKKAKQMRLERKIEKMRQKGIDVTSLKQKTGNAEKKLEDFLEEVPAEIRNKIEVRLVRTAPPSAEWLASAKESHRVYTLYQMKVHGDSASKCSERQFKGFLVDSPLQEEYLEDGPPRGYGSFHQQYWLDGRMIATGVIDVLPSCVSSVYFYYDPQVMSLNFGTYGALREISFTRQLNSVCPNLKYYYMGFYIHSCLKMRYKGNFHPSDLLCPETYKWFPLRDCIPKLEASPYSRLNPDIDAIDEEESTRSDLMNIPILVGTSVFKMCTYTAKKELKEHEIENLLEYGKMVGKTAASQLILVSGCLLPGRRWCCPNSCLSKLSCSKIFGRHVRCTLH